jgi:hypothetical protein
MVVEDRLLAGEGGEVVGFEVDVGFDVDAGLEALILAEDLQALV